MIVDSHCHAWLHWPYRPEVPDPESRGTVEQLLFEMDQNGVDQAAIVCAGIDFNPDNNGYVAEQVRCHPDRLYQIADVDCSWSPNYHQTGAAGRLCAAAARLPLVGFTHYLKPEDDGAWLCSDEGLAFFGAAAELGLLASLACFPHQQLAVRRVAERLPELPILLHHLGLAKAKEPDQLADVLACARHPNIHLKLSGFYYGTAGGRWDFPHRDTIEQVRALYGRFGPGHLCWGSDYPVCRAFISYRQALESFRTHCDFVPESEHALILGGNFRRLLRSVRPIAPVC